MSCRIFKPCIPKKPRPFAIFSAWSLLTVAEYFMMQAIFSEKLTDEPSKAVIALTVVLSALSVPLSALIDLGIKKCCNRNQVVPIDLPEFPSTPRAPSDPREPDPMPVIITM